MCILLNYIFSLVIYILIHAIPWPFCSTDMSFHRDILSTLWSVASWSLSMSLIPKIRMSSALSSTFGSPWNSLSIFLWNISPAVVTPNCSHMYLYLPKGQGKIARYDDCSSNFKLWYPELMSMSRRYVTLAGLHKMSSRLRTLWIGLGGLCFT